MRKLIAKARLDEIKPELREPARGLLETLISREESHVSGLLANVEDKVLRNKRIKKVENDFNMFSDYIGLLFERPLIELPNFNVDSPPKGSRKDYYVDLYDLPEEEYQRIYSQGTECFFSPFYTDSTYRLQYTKRGRFGATIPNDRFVRIDVESGEGTFLFDIKYKNGMGKVISTEWLAIPLSIDVDSKDKLHFAINHLKFVDEDGEPNATLLEFCTKYEMVSDGSFLGSDLEAKLRVDQIKEDVKNGVPMPFPALHRYISNRLNMLIERLGVLHVNDYYTFEVKPKGTKAKKGGGLTAKRKARAKQKQGIKHIFLNKINPAWVIKDEHGTERTMDRESHPRRGTWVTLNAERYKNHRRYKVYKGVYRKSTWVGPEQFEHQGNVYKILIPENDNGRTESVPRS